MKTTFLLLSASAALAAVVPESDGVVEKREAQVMPPASGGGTANGAPPFFVSPNEIVGTAGRTRPGALGGLSTSNNNDTGAAGRRGVNTERTEDVSPQCIDPNRNLDWASRPNPTIAQSPFMGDCQRAMAAFNQTIKTNLETINRQSDGGQQKSPTDLDSLSATFFSGSAYAARTDLVPPANGTKAGSLPIVGTWDSCSVVARMRSDFGVRALAFNDPSQGVLNTTGNTQAGAYRVSGDDSAPAPPPDSQNGTWGQLKSQADLLVRACPVAVGMPGWSLMGKEVVVAVVQTGSAIEKIWGQAN